MNAASRQRRRGARADYWPGFVDLMSTLLLVMIFLLVVYMLAQYFLQRSLSEEAEAKDDIQAELNSLDEMLSMEQQANADLRLNIAQLSSQLQASLSDRDRLGSQLSLVTEERDTLRLRLREMTDLEPTRRLSAPGSVRVDSEFRLFICDFGQHRLQVYKKEAYELGEDEILPPMRNPILFTT